MRMRRLCVMGRNDEDRVFIFTFHWWGVVQGVEAGVFLVGLESCPICRSPSRAPLSPPLVLSPARPPRPNERRARLTGQPTEAAGCREGERRGEGEETKRKRGAQVVWGRRASSSRFEPAHTGSRKASAQRLSPALPGPRRLWVFPKTFSAFASLRSGAAAG